MSRLTVFWLLHTIALAIFLVGSGVNVSIWLEGSVEGRPRAGLRGALGATWRWLRRAGLRRTARALLRDGLFHRRLFAAHRGRWLAHAVVLGAFGAMFALSVLTGFCQEVLIHLLHVRHPLLAAIANKDTPFIALANEALGLVMLAGVALIAVRRYVRRAAELRTGPADTALIVLLGATLLSGYPTEVLRLVMEQVPAEVARYSFLAYPLSLGLRGLDWPWQRLHYWTFIFHSTLASATIAYLPFGRLFHVFAGPLVATANAVAREVEGA